MSYEYDDPTGREESDSVNTSQIIDWRHFHRQNFTSVAQSRETVQDIDSRSVFLGVEANIAVHSPAFMNGG